MVRLPPLGLAVYHLYESPDSPMTLRSDTLLRLSGRGATARAADPLPVRSQQSDPQTFYISSQSLTLGFSGTTGLLEVCTHWILLLVDVSCCLVDVFLKVWRGKNKIWVLEKVKQIMYSCYTSILSPLLILPCYSVLLYCFFFFFCRVSSARMILRRSKFKYSSWSTAHAPPKTRVELTSSCLMEKQRCFLSSCFLDFYLPVRSL